MYAENIKLSSWTKAGLFRHTYSTIIFVTVCFSYAFEYKSMFDTLFAREKFKDSIEVASIGCGNMIDYWGLVEALGEIGSGECYIKYRGIDTIDWN